ncbi:hypothetical protein BC831DRAFT_513577 [Entophlyctis helioformis]|nr:hypothetical protein BC831DRAFT_513577 [Entophlyctis helioformis]
MRTSPWTVTSMLVPSTPSSSPAAEPSSKAGESVACYLQPRNSTTTTTKTPDAVDDAIDAAFEATPPSTPSAPSTPRSTGCDGLRASVVADLPACRRGGDSGAASESASTQARKPSQPTTLVPATVVQPVLFGVVDPDPAAGAVYSPLPWHRQERMYQQPSQRHPTPMIPVFRPHVPMPSPAAPSSHNTKHVGVADVVSAEPLAPFAPSASAAQQPHQYLNEHLLKTHVSRGYIPHKSTLQYSVHTPGRHLAREVALVFPGLVKPRADDRLPIVGHLKDLLIIPTFQESLFDLVAVTAETNWERNILLEYFMAFGRLFCGWLHERGYWADMTDPASGYPVFSDRGTSLYPDVDGCARLLKYATHLAGCCRVLDHPVWGTHSYPATMFSTAPPAVVVAALEFASSYGAGLVSRIIGADESAAAAAAFTSSRSLASAVHTPSMERQ